MAYQKIITHISTVHPLHDTRIFHKQFVSLDEAGFYVNLVVTHPQDEILQGIHILGLPVLSNRLFRMLKKPWMALKRSLSTHADIYHFHDPELIPVGLILRCMGKKVIYDVHEDYHGSILHKHWIPTFLRPLIATTFYALESFAARMFSGIVTATPHLEAMFLKFNPKTVCANNFPLLKEMSCDQNPSKVPGSVVYVGGITEGRGIVQLMEALEGTDIKLFLAGEFAPKSLQDACEKMPVWKNVDYLCHLNRTQVQEILSKSCVGILTFLPLPNHDHCRPNKIFEYMLAALPIVASHIPSWMGSFQQVHCISFVDPLFSLAIRQAIQDLLADPKQCHAMGARGRQAVIDQFNWDQEAKKILALYKTL